MGHRMDGLQRRGALGSQRIRFTPSTNLAYSLSTALPIYTLSFLGSSTTFGLILEFTTWYIWFVTVINTGAWGITQWLLNRTVIFRHDRAVRMARAQEE